jgi:hypothetical protein
MALSDAALKGNEEALGPPRSDPALHLGAGDRPELPSLGRVIVEELLELPTGHLVADQALADLDDLVFVVLRQRLPPLGE